MLRHSIVSSKLFAEIVVTARNGSIRVARYHKKSKFHNPLILSDAGTTSRRPPLVDPKLQKLSESISPSVMAATKARPFKIGMNSLTAEGLLRFKKPSIPPPTSASQVLHEYQLLANENVAIKSTKKRSKMKGVQTSTTIMDEYGYSEKEESFPITAYAVCEEFDLKGMHKGLISQGLYIPTVLLDDLSDVIHVSAKYPIGDEPREIFFFREGAVVFWNVSYLEIVNVLKFLKEYEDESYSQEEIDDEVEYMSYVHSEDGSTRLVRGKVFLGDETSNNLLEKYAFANALASSVKLGMWESTLEKYAQGIENITDTLKRGDEIKLSRAQVMRKTGELFALRHQLNLNSDLLDTPDFYWERERLETLYQKTCDYLSIHRRTKVMNEKLSQCCELLDLISSHLTDQHHTRLEWMIIVLIMIEVAFEILHLLERYELIHI